jgi:hypothetical protein
MPALTLPGRHDLAALSGLLGYPLLRVDALFSASGCGTSGWLVWQVVACLALNVGSREAAGSADKSSVRH